MNTMEERILKQINDVKEVQDISFAALVEILYKKGLLTEEEYNSIINNE